VVGNGEIVALKMGLYAGDRRAAGSAEKTAEMVCYALQHQIDEHLGACHAFDSGRSLRAPDQSGQPGSPHYDDLLPLWQKGEYFPLAFSRAKIEHVTRHRLKLQPAGR
jgi:acyl-homoserine lactone acylase PvdQ